MHPILFRFGEFQLATYGFFVAAGYLAGILWVRTEREYMGLTDSQFWNLIYCLFFGAIVGGKLLYIMLEWPRFASGEMRLLRDFRFGFVFYGGFFGAIVMALLYLRFDSSRFLKFADYFGVTIPLGHAIGRLGCLAAGCCYGRPTRMPWGISFTRMDSLIAPEFLNVPLHPAQLYESAGNVLIAVLMLRLLRKTQGGKVLEGTVFFTYIVSYAFLRFLVEFFRGDDRGVFWLGLSPSQWIALLCIVLGLTFMARRGIRCQNSAS